MTIQKIINFIEYTCLLYRIDDSHGLDHSLKTLFWSLKISKDMILTYHETQVIKISCLLHDMCDKKYMDEMSGVRRIKQFLTNILKLDSSIIESVLFIITTMSYSKVIKNGYPNFEGDKSIEKCYHIVRNSDLLGSYDPERCIAYHLRCNGTRQEGILKMLDIFEKRVLKLIEHGYINMDSAKEYAIELHKNSIVNLEKYKLEIN